MLTNLQKSLLKRGQRQAALSDQEYREALELVTGFCSSRHPDFTNRQLDTVLAYMEAIYFHKVDAGALQPPGSAAAVFRQRGYWAAKNNSQETSRDRHRDDNLGQGVAALEGRLAALGFGPAYCAAIRQKAAHGRADERGQYLYRAALERTLRAKAQKAEREQNTF